MKTLFSVDYHDGINFGGNKVWRILNKLAQNEGPVKDREKVLIHGSCQKLVLVKFKRNFYFEKPFLKFKLNIKIRINLNLVPSNMNFVFSFCPSKLKQMMMIILLR